jgi:hypothetical protein
MSNACRNARNWLAGAMCVALLAAAEPKPDDTKVPELNRKVLQFCTDNLGKKVDNGECALLAICALRAAGAKPAAPPEDPKPPMTKEDPVFGRLLGPDDEVLPGDVMQFRDVEIKIMASGRVVGMMSFPHHTAVVSQVLGKQKYAVLHQNVGGPDSTEEQRRVVQKGTIDLGGKVKGTVWIYRPLEK